MLERLTARKEWQFFSVLPKAAPWLAAAWWAVLLLRGLLPAAFAIAMGALVGAVRRADPLSAELAAAGTIFVLLQVLSPIHQALSANLGDRTAAWLYDRLTDACVRPSGVSRLEDPTLTSDLMVAPGARPRHDRQLAAKDRLLKKQAPYNRANAHTLALVLNG